MATNIEGLSIQIKTSAGDAQAALGKLNAQLVLLSSTLRAIDTSKLEGAFKTLSTTLQENGIVVNHYIRQAKETKGASSDAAEGVSEMSGELNKATESEVALGEGMQSAAAAVEDATSDISKGAEQAEASVVELSDKGVQAAKDEAAAAQEAAKEAKKAAQEREQALNNAIQSARDSASGMNQAFSALGGNGGFIGEMFSKIQSAATGFGRAFGFSKEETLQLSQALGSMGMVVGITTSVIENVKKSVQQIIDFLKMGVEIIKGAYQSYKKFIKLLADVTGFSRLKQEISSILSMLKRQVIRRLINNYIKAIEDAFDTGITNLAAYDARFADAMQSYRNAMGLFRNSVTVALAPIISYFIPYIVKFINGLTWACNQIARLTALLTGQKTYTIARSFESIENSANAAGSAAKEAAKTILGFDEINQLNGNKGSGGGGGAGSGDGISAYETLDVGEWPYHSWGEAFSAFLDWLNGKIPDLRKILSGAADNFNEFNQKLLEMFTFDGVKEKIAELGTNLGQAINEFINDKLDWKTWGSAFGAVLGAALNFAYNFLMQFEWVKFGANLAEFISSAIDQIDPEQLGVVLAQQFTILFDIVTGFLSDVKAMAKIGEWAGKVVASFVEFIADKILTADFESVRKGIMAFLENALDILNKKGTFKKLMAAIERLGKFVGSLLVDLAKSPQIRALVAQAISVVGKVAWETLKALLQGLGTLMTEAIGDYLSNLPTIWGNYLGAMGNFLTSPWGLLGYVGAFGVGLDSVFGGIETSVENHAVNASKSFESIGVAAGKVSQDVGASSRTVSAQMKTMADNANTYSNNAKNSVTNNLVRAKTDATKAASDLQVGVTNNLKNLSGAATNGVNGLTKNVTDGLNLAKNNAVKAATDAQKGVTNAFSTMYGGAKGGMNNMIYGAEKMANGIIDANNSILKSFDSMNIGGKKVAASSGYVSKVTIPRLATGGIISSPTQAIIGERGAEAVVPLERNTGWIDRLASTIAQSVSQTPSSQSGDIYVTLDGKVIAKAVNRINERDTRRYSPVG